MEHIPESKTERIDIRISPATKRILQYAAVAMQKNVSEFLVEHGLAAASEALCDRRLFTLDEVQWDAFQAALDRPYHEQPRLKKLLTEPGIFD